MTSTTMAVMRTIVVASQKGGAGKTSLLRNVAVAAAAERQGVVMLDADPQGSLTRWYSVRGRDVPGLVRLDSRPIPELLAGLREAGADLVFVDTPPAASPFTGELITLADLVVLPVQATPDDLGAIGPTLDLVEAAGKPFAFVLSRVKYKSRLAAEARRVLGEHGRVAQVELSDLVDYPLAATRGLAVGELAPEGKAATEVRELWRFVERLLDARRRKAS
jgi:chromosome partitioning protein